mmetsp:Transcript_18277/g.27701  ORF Transcript_18277/g.27701 Transcript_18277/m.27701 type:complete len:865 (-) Transcript_18277:83-2677(-)
MSGRVCFQSDGRLTRSFPSNDSFSTPARTRTSARKFMKTPGLSIPTPKKTFNDEFEEEEDIDETAFLPNNLTTHVEDKENMRSYTLAEVQEQIEKAIKSAQGEWEIGIRGQLEAEYQTKLEELQKDAEESLLEHSRHWEEDHTKEISRIKSEFIQRQQEGKKNFDLQITKIHGKHEDDISALDQKLKYVEKMSQNEILQLQEDQDEYYNSKLELLKAEFTREREDLTSKIELADLQVDNKNSKIQELCQKIELLESNQSEMKKNKAAHEEELHSKLQSLQAALVAKHNQEVESLIKENVQKIEHERQAATRDQKSREMHFVEKISMLEATDKLKAEEHRDELQKLRESFIDQLHFARQEIQNHVAAKKDLKIKEAKLLDELSEVKAKSNQAVEELIEKHSKEIRQLEEELKEKLESERKEIDRKLTESLDCQEAMKTRERQLVDKIRKLEAGETQEAEQHKTDLEELKKSLMDQLQVARQEIQDHIAAKEDLKINEGKLLEEIFEVKAESIRRLEDLDKKHCMLMKQLEQESQKKTESEREEMERKLKDSLESQEAIFLSRETELAKLLSQLEKASETDRGNYNERVEEVRKKHTTEIDDMLVQLDLLEAEHKDRTRSLEQAVNHKDTVISALGTQLAEANRVTGEMKSLQDNQLTRITKLSDDLKLSQQEVTTNERTHEIQQKEMKQLVEQEKKLRNAACEKVRNETVAAAEEQFNKANEHYLTLKHRYDNVVARVATLEKEIKSAKRQLEDAKTAQASREAELTAELAQFKADLATTEANAAKEVKEFKRETEKLKRTQQDAQVELDDARTERDEFSRKLELAIKEKKSLVKEIADLNAVCEEMMAMVESCSCKLDSDQASI